MARVPPALFPERRELPPGALIHEEGVFAVGGDGASLELLEVQLEGRKKMPAKSSPTAIA